jgi:hypothetical protein
MIPKAVLMRESTQNRDAFFTDFVDRVQKLSSPVLVQLTGGFRCVRSRRARQYCTYRIFPSKDTLLNPGLLGDIAIALPHIDSGEVC